MTTTRCIFLPEGARFPSTNFPQLLKIDNDLVLGFDAATAETCYWGFIAWQGLTGTMTAVVSYIMASATSGKVDFEVSIEAITPGDATDIDAVDSFDTANTITAPTVPGTAGYLGTFSCTLTNQDGIAAADWCRIRLVRDATDATNDTATGDCYILGVELRDAA